MVVSTGGQLDLRESQLHINCLKLLAGAFAIQTFAKRQSPSESSFIDGQHNGCPLYQQDGANKISHSCTPGSKSVELVPTEPDSRGGTVHPGGSECQSGQGIPGYMLDLHDWRLHPNIFMAINQLWGPVDVDLFASRLTAQVPRFYSWRPDPQAEATDAFAQEWATVKGYAFLPFGLIGRCLRKLLYQGVSRLVLIAPIWKSQPWYPLLLDLRIASPVLLPQRPGLLTRHGEIQPLSHLQLAGWLLSADPTLRQAFLKMRKTCSLPPGGRVPPPLTPQLGGDGLAGAVNRSLIQFSHQLRVY